MLPFCLPGNNELKLCIKLFEIERCCCCMANIFIVGGSSGIGLQLAGQLQAAGYMVYATYSKNRHNDSPNLFYHPLDVLGDVDCSFLPDVIDGFVYCPGSIQLKPFNRFSSKDFTDDFELNVTGAIKCLQAVLPRMKHSSAASVVFFSTVAVQLGLPFHSLVSSCKGAIEGLTRSLAAELAPKIRVNCIAPSLTDTPLAASLLNTQEKKEANAMRHPLKKIGEPADIANMAAFLLSENAAWITGQVLKVDGGMSSIKTS